MQVVIDILENELIEKYPTILDILLKDQTTKKNIFWATENYKHLGQLYTYNAEIVREAITGEKGNVIMPRVHKDKVLQQARSKEMAEVFTPSWICNNMNNLIDNAWFGKVGVFNTEIVINQKTKSWETNREKITFPEGKTWQEYVLDTRLEITCGEAPYIVSRYDTTTGKSIKIEDRIGLLDRKLRVINENVNTLNHWLNATEIAYKNIYGFEWQGDSLLLAREALLITFIENYSLKFGTEPTLENIQTIAEIISWNIWQMDGLKGTIPNSCTGTTKVQENLFGEIKTVSTFCEGCFQNNIKKHSGIYCHIMDWSVQKPVKFISLLEK